METISNVVSSVQQTATKAIWGEPNETAGNEPVSGVQGKGTANEPFDAGNSEDPTSSTTRNETAGTEPLSGLAGKGTATDPFDQGNSADSTNTATLPIREKSSSDAPDFAARPDETNTAGLAGTANLSDTLSKTDAAPLKTDAAPLKTDTVPASRNEPPLAGFSDNRKIDPADKSQLPAEVSNATTGDSLTSSTPVGSGITGTTSSTATESATTNPAVTSITTPKSQPAVGTEGSDPLSTQKGVSEHETTHTTSTSIGAGGADTTTTKTGLLEKKNEDRDTAAAAATSSTGTTHKDADKETSPVGEKEKVSKMEKLKEKLHIKKH